METEESASACLELNRRDVDGRHIRVDLVTPTKDTHCSVFVGNAQWQQGGGGVGGMGPMGQQQQYMMGPGGPIQMDRAQGIGSGLPQGMGIGSRKAGNGCGSLWVPRNSVSTS
uniref:Uncharacterized protein n=1 Tax=Amphimedon queenslandica TaxID=400682 RepID=A0A1X7TF14_AMPQE